MNKTLTVALYIRVSTEEQVKHGYSIQAQKESLTAYCKQNKYKIYDYYIDEGKSARAKLTSRKEMLRLIEDVKLNQIDRVVFIKLDRWFRNIADYYKVQEILDKYKVDWETTQEEYNTTTSSGKLNLNIRLSIAQDEADRTGDRIRFTFQNMVNNKRAIYGKQCLPLGFMVKGEERNKRIVKDPNESPIVEDMFDHFKTFGSIRFTLRYINKKYNLNILYDSMTRYFKSTLYYGYYKGVEGYCDNYITKDEFDEIRGIVEKNTRHGKQEYEYIFKGLLKCPICHCNYSGFPHRATKPKYNKVYLNRSYRCNKHYGSKICSNNHTRFESKIETQLLSTIKSEIEQYLKTITDRETKDNIKTKIVDINKLEKKLERLSELYIEGKITKEKYNSNYNSITEEISNNKIVKKARDLSKLEKLLNTDLNSLYNELSNEEKRAFWKSFIDYIEMDKKTFHIIFK